MAAKVKQVLAEKGPESIGMFGSGQWTVMEGYAASAGAACHPSPTARQWAVNTMSASLANSTGWMSKTPVSSPNATWRSCSSR